jgi:hypothetical protein
MRKIIVVESKYFAGLQTFAELAQEAGYYVAMVYPTAMRVGPEHVDEAFNLCEPVWENESEVVAVIPDEEGLTTVSEMFLNRALKNPEGTPALLLSSHVEELATNLGSLEFREWRRKANQETVEYLAFIPRP